LLQIKKLGQPWRRFLNAAAPHGHNGQRVKIRASGVSFYYDRFRALVHRTCDDVADLLRVTPPSC
jgi:hypothetical protein